jgi:hypothetical protein
MSDHAKFMARLGKITLGSKEIKAEIFISRTEFQRNFNFMMDNQEEQIHVMLGDPQVSFQFPDQPQHQGVGYSVAPDGTVNNVQAADVDTEEEQDEMELEDIESEDISNEEDQNDDDLDESFLDEEHTDNANGSNEERESECIICYKSETDADADSIRSTQNGLWVCSDECYEKYYGFKPGAA